VVDEAVHLIELTKADDGIRFEANCTDDILLTGNRQQLAQVLVNLLSNAADASQPGDRVDLLARSQGSEAVIEIMDQGQGIPDELQETIFEPFYTTKPTGQGTGLGLSLAYKIIEDHRGTLRIDSQKGLGTRVVSRCRWSLRNRLCITCSSLRMNPSSAAPCDACSNATATRSPRPSRSRRRRMGGWDTYSLIITDLRLPGRSAAASSSSSPTSR
jgi:hypothetical protein